MKLIKRQPHQGTCGIVAIVNILRSFGKKASYNKILKECGGLKKVSKRGITISMFSKILRKHRVESIDFHATRRQMKELAKDPNIRIALAYVWLTKIDGKMQGGPHIVMIDKNGRGINTNKYSRINGQRWRDSKKIWGFPPVTFMCVPLFQVR